MNTYLKGRFGESIALKYLKMHGFSILERNAHVKWGEIDIIGCKGSTLVFFEVKYSNSRIEPEEMYTHYKRVKLLRSIYRWECANVNYRIGSKFLVLIAIHTYQGKTVVTCYPERLS